jgi:hypothetical protein
MNGKANNYKFIFSLLGLFYLFVPIYLFMLWFRATNLGNSHSECVAIYNSYLPDFLKGSYKGALCSIFFSMLAIAFCIINIQTKIILFKIINIIVLTISSLFMLWNLFTLM